MAGTMSRTLQPVLSVVLIDGTIQLYFNVIKSGLDSEKAIHKFLILNIGYDLGL